MHRIFTTIDLLLELLDLLVLRDKVHFGKSCKIIWSIAVPQVWREVRGERAILGFLYRDGGHPVQWNRLRDYSRHTRLLSLVEQVDSEPLASLPVIAMYDGRKSLFSGLMSLHLHLAHEETILASGTLMKVPLRDLNIDILEYDEEQTESVTLLLKAAGTCHTIEALALNVGPGRDGAIASCLSRLRSLKTVAVEDISFPFAVLSSASELPSLRTCALGLTGLRSGMDLFHFSAGAFPSLERFSLRGVWFVGLPGVRDLLEVISSRVLKELQFCSTDPAILRATCSIVQRKWSHSMLSMGLYFKSDVPQTNNALLASLEPLFACRELQGLYVRSNQAILPSDADSYAMSGAWPGLRELSLADKPNDDPDDSSSGSDEETEPWPLPLATRRSLIYFATRCRVLQSLAMSVNFDRDTTAFNTDNAPFTSAVWQLNCQHSTTSEPQKAADFLRAIFPGLTCFSARRPEDHMYRVAELMNLRPCPTRHLSWGVWHTDERGFISDDI